MTVSIDELGPVDWIVVEFPGTKLTREIAPIIKDYVDRGLIRGQLAASGRIPVQPVLAAIEADAGEGA